MEDDSGRRYLRETRHTRRRLVGGRMDWAHQPEWFKTYPDAPRVALPGRPAAGAGTAEAPVRPLAAAGVFEALARRRSLRRYGAPPLDLEDLGALLWAAAGVTAEESGFAFRTAPSAGGLYPIETYVAAHGVEDLTPGIYHYAVLDRALERLRAGDFRRQVAQAALDQPIAATADAVFIWTAVLERSSWKYGPRFARYVFLDAGHIAENVALAAVALGLGSCQIAAFYDDEAAGLLGVDIEREPVLYMTTLGRPS